MVNPNAKPYTQTQAGQRRTGSASKGLQNLVQLGVIRPARRNNVCWFDTNLLLEAKVAFYLKETLGSSSDLLARFTEAFSKNLGKAKMGDLEDICLRSRPLNGTTAVDIKIPVRSWLGNLEDQIPLASAYEDLPKGRKRAGWKKDFLRSAQKAAADLGDISEEEILQTIREYRSDERNCRRSRSLPAQKKQPRGVVDTSVLVAGIAGLKSTEIARKNPSAKLLQGWIEGNTFVWLVSDEILLEYKQVLGRLAVRRPLIGKIINLLREEAELVPASALPNIVTVRAFLAP